MDLTTVLLNFFDLVVSIATGTGDVLSSAWATIEDGVNVVWAWVRAALSYTAAGVGYVVSAVSLLWEYWLLPGLTWLYGGLYRTQTWFTNVGSADLAALYNLAVGALPTSNILAWKATYAADFLVNSLVNGRAYVSSWFVNVDSSFATLRTDARSATDTIATTLNSHADWINFLFTAAGKLRPSVMLSNLDELAGSVVDVLTHSGLPDDLSSRAAELADKYPALTAAQAVASLRAGTPRLSGELAAAVASLRAGN